jgi:hypothetical protein
MNNTMNSGGPGQPTHAVWAKQCVVFGGGGGNDPSAPIIAGGNLIGAQASLIRAAAISSRYPHTNPWIGFNLRFPLPFGQATNEARGYGVRYKRKCCLVVAG